MTAIARLRRIVFTAMLAGSALAHAGDLIDLRSAERVRGDAAAGKAKATVCSACHGTAGIALVPAFPNLAGQNADYVYWRLVAFKRGVDPDSPMTAQAANLDDTAMRDLAAYFASLPPAAGHATGDAAMAGAAIYRDGDPARGIPPCQGCHGADARGHTGTDAGRNAQSRIYPALRGQHAPYIAKRLADLAGDASPRTSASHVMAPIARTLDAASVEAIAHWLEAGAP
ncbi:MAG TPA: c-type cytochrome [Dokdonella sp.]|nr:c-type cytochrome [Dokdonella sp.]